MITNEALQARTVFFHWWIDINGEYQEDMYQMTGSPYPEDWS
jgi:hypothetical protein